MNARALFIHALIFLLAMQPALSHAAPRDIPTTPSAPPSFVMPEVYDYFRCEREIALNGKKYKCDSYGRADAEKLRVFVKDIPEAVQEINLYQRTRITNKTLAYVSSTGVFIVVLGLLVGALVRRNSPASAQIVRDTTLFGGIWLATNSFIYGVGAHQDNEDHLVRAVELYNNAHPDKPMELHLNLSLPF